MGTIAAATTVLSHVHGPLDGEVTAVVGLCGVVKVVVGGDDVATRVCVSDKATTERGPSISVSVQFDQNRVKCDDAYRDTMAGRANSTPWVSASFAATAEARAMMNLQHFCIFTGVYVRNRIQASKANAGLCRVTSESAS